MVEDAIQLQVERCASEASGGVVVDRGVAVGVGCGVDAVGGVWDGVVALRRGDIASEEVFVVTCGLGAGVGRGVDGRVGGPLLAG